MRECPAVGKGGGIAERIGTEDGISPAPARAGRVERSEPISDRVDPDGKNMTAIVMMEGPDTLGRRVRYAPDRYRLVANLRST